MSEIDKIHQLFEEARILKNRPGAGELRKQILTQSKLLTGPDALLNYLHDKDWRMRQIAAEALGQFEQPEVAQRLIERFELETEADDEEVQVEIVISLRNQKTLLALQALIEIAKDKSYTSWVRSEAAYGVAVSTAKNVIDPLLDIVMSLPDHDDSDVIDAVFDAFNALEASPKSISAKLTDMLQAGTLPDYSITGAIHYLGLWKHKPAFDVILQYLDNEEFCWPAAVALGNLGDLRALPKLKEKENNCSELVKLPISKAIEQLQSQSQDNC